MVQTLVWQEPQRLCIAFPAFDLTALKKPSGGQVCFMGLCCDKIVVVSYIMYCCQASLLYRFARGSNGAVVTHSFE